MNGATQICRYSQANRAEWDAFVTASKNGTFLFCRDYMDYHRDRFQDCSLLIRNQDGRILALLPGHVAGSDYASHSGLTYGGFLTDSSMKLPVLLRLFDAAMTWLFGNGIARVLYKTIPHIYHRAPAEEDRYALFLAGAEWVRSGMLTVICTKARLPYQERRRRSLKKAMERGLEVRCTDDFPAYWQILSDLLMTRFRTRPVHSLEEIEGLHGRLPEHIELHGCFHGSKMLAGAVVYRSSKVLRTQYLASTAEGRGSGALDLLVDSLVNTERPGIEYIDLGTCDEQNSRLLNGGLMEQKEGFGARSVALDQYVINVAGWEPGKVAGAIQ